MNTELKKNVEGYADPTAAATLNRKEAGDIWTYDGNHCLIIKDHGQFSTILILVDESRNASDVRIETSRGTKFTDPRRLTYGKNYKMYSYVETVSVEDFEYVCDAVTAALGVELPCNRPTDWEDLPAIEAQVHDLLTERDALLVEVKRLESRLEFMTDMHAKAVDRVNKVSFAKLKVVNQLELLQGMVGSVLAHFQVDTEEG